jgi:hypothetical protein
VSCSVLITFHKCLIRYSSSFLNVLRIQPADVKGDLLDPLGFALTVCPHKLIFLRLAALSIQKKTKHRSKLKIFESAKLVHVMNAEILFGSSGGQPTTCGMKNSTSCHMQMQIGRFCMFAETIERGVATLLFTENHTGSKNLSMRWFPGCSTWLIRAPFVPALAIMNNRWPHHRTRTKSPVMEERSTER